MDRRKDTQEKRMREREKEETSTRGMGDDAFFAFCLSCHIIPPLVDHFVHFVHGLVFSSFRLLAIFPAQTKLSHTN